VPLLLSAGANVNAASMDSELVSLILAAKANVNAVDLSGGAALM
jgi:hypothetical protein